MAACTVPLVAKVSGWGRYFQIEALCNQLLTSVLQLWQQVLVGNRRAAHIRTTQNSDAHQTLLCTFCTVQIYGNGPSDLRTMGRWSMEVRLSLEWAEIDLICASGQTVCRQSYLIKPLLVTFIFCLSRLTWQWSSWLLGRWLAFVFDPFPCHLWRLQSDLTGRNPFATGQSRPDHTAHDWLQGASTCCWE